MSLQPITRLEHFYARIAGDPGKIFAPITRTEHFLQRIIDVLSGGGGSVTVDSALSSSSENPVQNKVINTALGLKADAAALNDYEQKPTVVTDLTSTSITLAAQANTEYHYGELTSLTISNPPATGAYSIVFTSGSTATTTTIPATVLGLEDFAPETNTIYEINVLDNRAVVGSWAVTA